MKKKWNEGLIIAAILSGIGGAIILAASFYVSLLWLSRTVFVSGEKNAVAQEKQEDFFFGQKNGEDGSWSEPEPEIPEPGGKEYDSGGLEDYNTQDDEYYDFHNAVREDLSYSIDFSTFKYMPDEALPIVVTIDYPFVQSWGKKDPERVNRIIKKELTQVEEYVDSLKEQLSGEDEFSFRGTGYVTYMSEDILSVAYVEESYYNGEQFEACVVSVNIDMETGMAITNSQILDIDDEFAIEFRERSDVQNGEVDSMSYFSDQEIAEYLNDEDSLIIFYTPLGMEVGFNYYYGWVTVTYKDYLDFQKKL